MSLNIFSNDDEKYFSNTVKEEVKTVIRKKFNDFKKFLKKLSEKIDKLKKDAIINLSTIHSIIDKFKRIGKLNVENMHDILDEIWKNKEYGEYQEVNEILNSLNDVKLDFRCKILFERNIVFENLNEIPNHSSKDQKVLRIIEEENLREHLDEKDEEILFDLNEYARKHPQLDLCLVSWDDGFIKAVKILLDRLSFKKYISRDEI